MNPIFNVQMKGNGRAAMEIYGQIGPASLGMIDTKTVSDGLAQMGSVNEIVVSMNSRGGDAFCGLAIYNLLKNHRAKVHVRVMGIAASAASLIAMAGDKVEVPGNALMMLHNPHAVVLGGSEDMRRCAETLDRVRDASVATYAAKTRKSRQQIESWMSAETWFSGQEAIDAGLADTLMGESVNVENKTTAAAMFSRDAQAYTLAVALNANAPAPTGHDPQRLAVELEARRDYAANRAHYQRHNITEQDLTRTMLINAGLEQLIPSRA